MQLTIFTDYGLRALMYLARHRDRLCNVKEIAEHYGISRNHLVKIVHRLGQLGHVETSKGKGGGVRLARDAGQLRLGDLVKSLEPGMDLVECFNEDTNTCKIIGTCRLKHYLFEARLSFLESLNRHTLNDATRGLDPFGFLAPDAEPLVRTRSSPSERS